MLDCASDILFPALTEIDIPSPDELSKLGVCDERKLAATLALGDFLVLPETAYMLEAVPSDVRFFVDVVEAIEADVGGREGAFGGLGKEPMLTVFRTDLLEGIPDAFSPTLEENSGVELTGCDVGKADGLEGAFNLDGVWGRPFRGGLLVGMGGSGPIGGWAKGRDETGKDMSTECCRGTICIFKINWNRPCGVCSVLGISFLRRQNKAVVAFSYVRLTVLSQSRCSKLQWPVYCAAFLVDWIRIRRSTRGL